MGNQRETDQETLFYDRLKKFRRRLVAATIISLIAIFLCFNFTGNIFFLLTGQTENLIGDGEELQKGKKFPEGEIVEEKIPEEKINPGLRPFAAKFPPTVTNYETLMASRGMPPMFPPAVSTETVTVTEKHIPGPEGAPDVHIRIFSPVEKEKLVGGLLWIHGGGYMYELMEMEDSRCLRFAQEANCVVVSVDYRVAPENPYPAPLDDCYAALEWFSKNAEMLGVDDTRIAIGGGSAGAGLAAGVCLWARDNEGPKIAFQMPLCPMIDDRHITPSSTEVTDRRFWNLEANIFGWASYLGDIPYDEVPIYAAPARAKDLSGLPPAYFFVGELDLFRDEAINFANRLIEAGVTTEFHIFPGCFHGFEILADGEISRIANDETVRALKIALEQ